MLRCIAIDDEPLALELLEDNISKLPYLQLVAKCSNPLGAMKVLQQQPVDLIFLDIQMPGLTGLQFIQSLQQKPMFILVTAYEKYALEGYNLDVVDYLVKPVSTERFIKACNKAWELHQLKQKPIAQWGSAPTYIFVPADYSMLKVVMSEISWIEGLKDYIKIHLTNNSKPIVTRMTMKAIEEMLPGQAFIRIHKSYIVSVAAITAIRKTNVLLGSIELPVSETYQEALLKITGKHS
jgi:two-component system, LytTR family, response regulator